jgi:ribosomal protein S7
MKTETHIQTTGPIFRRDGSIEWQFQVVHWEYNGRKQEAERVISDAWKIIEKPDGAKERIGLMGCGK